MSLLPPKATRDGNKFKKRLQYQAQKAYDKHKLAEDQLEAERLKLLAKAAKDESSDQEDRTILDSKGLYFADLETLEAFDGDESDSLFSASSAFTRSTFLAQFCSKIVPTRKLRLSWKEYMCFSLILQLHFSFISMHLSLINRWGASIVLAIYILVTAALSVPVYTVYVFVGTYTRRYYIKYWDAVPFLKGVAYSIAAALIYIEIFNVSAAIIAFHYITLLFSKTLPWTTCNFPRHSSECLVGYTNKSHTKQCCNTFRDPNCTQKVIKENLAKYTTFDYYNSQVLGAGYGEEPLIKTYLTHLIIKAAIIWFLLFVIMVIGLRRFSKILAIIIMIMFASLVPVVVFTFAISPQYPVVRSILTTYKSVKDYSMWIKVAMLLLQREHPGDVLTLSAASRTGISVTVDTIILYTLKLFFTITFTVWIPLTLNYIQKKYNVSDDECLILKGDFLLFAMFPDVLSDLPFAHVWLLWYFSVVFVWCISSAICCFNSFLEALCDQFSMLNQWRVGIAGVLCLAGGTATGLLLEPTMPEKFREIALEIAVDQKVTILFLSLTGLFLYSLNRIKNDYHFYSGTILGNYWIYGVKAAMLTMTLSALVLLYTKITKTNRVSPITIAVLTPTIIGCILASLRYSLKISKTLINPNVAWGPPNRRQRLARVRFDPTHDLKYRSISNKCEHNCILHSSALKKETKYWLGKIQQIEEQNEQDSAGDNKE